MVGKANNDRHDADEESPLLPPDSSGSGSRRNVVAITPLPKLQLSILLLLHFCERICLKCIDPFINQLIRDFGINGGDESQTGYYAGLIVSLFDFGKAITVFQWGRLSDSIGRKPVLLTGLFGVTISMIGFGLSRTFVALIVTRCLAGLLNGNVGIIKSIIGEITDSTNRAQGFAMLPLTSSIGTTIGPLIGGFLSRPQDRFPEFFKSPFWATYPYFLPCVASASFVCTGFFIGLFFFKETIPSPKHITVPTTPEGTPDRPAFAESQVDRPVTLRALLVYPVLVSVANYATLSFIDAALLCLTPLFLSTPIEFGGLGLSPLDIGRWLSFMGFTIGIFQIFCLAPLMRRFGPKRVLISGILLSTLSFALFPLAHILARSRGVGLPVLAVLSCQLVCNFLLVAGYGKFLRSILPNSDFLTLLAWGLLWTGSIFIFVTTANPNPRSLGTTNGLSQTTASISRTAGRVTAASAFAFSAEHNLLGGYAVYGAFIVLVGVGLLGAARLPEWGWDRAKSSEVRETEQ